MSSTTYTFGVDTSASNVSTTTFTTTTTGGPYYYYYGQPSTIKTPQQPILISGVLSLGTWETKPVIKFGFYLKFKRSKAKLVKGWEEEIDYTQGTPVVTNELKRLL